VIAAAQSGAGAARGRRAGARVVAAPAAAVGRRLRAAPTPHPPNLPARCRPRCAAAAALQQRGAPHYSSEPPAAAAAALAGRRSALLSAATAGLAALAPAPARAASVAPPAPPGLAARLLPVPLPLPLGGPEPVAFPRKTLDQRFAVLLMRSSYDAVDALDFMSMEKFQVGGKADGGEGWKRDMAGQGWG
jgi:hypothetical protein